MNHCSDVSQFTDNAIMNKKCSAFKANLVDLDKAVLDKKEKIRISDAYAKHMNKAYKKCKAPNEIAKRKKEIEKQFRFIIFSY